MAPLPDKRDPSAFLVCLGGKDAAIYDYNSIECFEKLADIQDACFKKA